jgi:hypothetical protein
LAVFLLVAFRWLINPDETPFPWLLARHFLEIYTFGWIIYIFWTAPGYFGRRLNSPPRRVIIVGLIAAVICIEFLLGISNATFVPRLVIDPLNRSITTIEYVMEVGKFSLPSGYEFGLFDIIVGFVVSMTLSPLLFIGFFGRNAGRARAWRIGLIYTSLMCAIPLCPLLALLAFMGIGLLLQ